MGTQSRNLFAMLPEQIRQGLFQAGTLQKYRKGQQIFGAVEPIGDICFLTEGYVSLYRSSYHGDERTIFICGAGEILNELVLENEKPSVAAKALRDCTVLRVPRESLDCLPQRELLMQLLFHSLAQKTRRLYHKVGNDNGTYALKNRLAAVIRKLARDYGTETEKGIRIDFEVTVNLLSSMLGAKRETISRALSELKRNGLILHENGVLTVTDLPGLFRDAP